MVSNKPMIIVTLPFYGILATEKSNLLGRRRLVKAHHATFLAYRVLGSRLPAELVDQIAEDITALEYADMLKLRRKLACRQDHRSALFTLPAIDRTVAEKAASKELALMSVGTLTSGIIVDTPNAGHVRYTRITSNKNRPSLVELVPGAVPASGPKLLYADGRLQVTCNPAMHTQQSLERMKLLPSSEELKVGRVVQIDGIEEAIREWDQEVAERYVKFLGLKVVSMNGEDDGDLTPRLRLLQIVRWF
jgi:hypothetical protein